MHSLRGELEQARRAYATALGCNPDFQPARAALDTTQRLEQGDEGSSADLQWETETPSRSDDRQAEPAPPTGLTNQRMAEYGAQFATIFRPGWVPIINLAGMIAQDTGYLPRP